MFFILNLWYKLKDNKKIFFINSDYFLICQIVSFLWSLNKWLNISKKYQYMLIAYRRENSI